jgi:glutamine synthetase
MNGLAQVPAFAGEAVAALDQLLAQDPAIASIDALLVDINGILRGKRLPVSEARRLFENGMQIPRTVFLMDPLGEMTSPFGRGFADGDPDGTAWPIPGTLTRVQDGGPPRAQFLMTMRDAQGAPDIAEPRGALERIGQRFLELGLRPVVALELEFYLIDRERGPNGAPQPPMVRSHKRDEAHAVYALENLESYGGFLESLNEASRLQGVPLGAASSEYGPGQFEVNLRHQPDILSAADHAVILKQMVRAAARSSGLDVTFMAKPHARRTGSGLHVHVSLLGIDGQNAFDDGSVEGSETLHHAIGGLRALMPESMAFFAPSINSYRRFQPDMFAPVNRSWAVNNRSVGLRIPVSPGGARRIEHRAAGADANPYFALACVLAGIHFGIEKKIDPGPPTSGNASQAPDMALPFTIDDALAKLGSAATLPLYFQPETLSLYGESKRLELARFRNIVSRAEYEWYL